MTYWQDIVFSLILAPIRSGLSTSRRPRLLPLYIGVFLLIIGLRPVEQKKPLKYYALPSI
jgi:hypothetical protein